MNTQISRKRIVELAHESTEKPYQFDEEWIVRFVARLVQEDPYQFDEGWIVRFMTRLAQEDPTLAEAVKKAADKRLKELDD